MSVEDNKGIVHRYWEVFHQHDVDVLDSICTPDVVNHGDPSRVRHGREDLKQLIGGLIAAIPDQRFESQHVIAEGDHVVWSGTWSGTYKGEKFRGYPVSLGNHFSKNQIHIFRFSDGKIAEHWAVRDDLGMLQELGGVPLPE